MTEEVWRHLIVVDQNGILVHDIKMQPGITPDHGMRSDSPTQLFSSEPSQRSFTGLTHAVGNDAGFAFVHITRLAKILHKGTCRRLESKAKSLIHQMHQLLPGEGCL